MNTNVNNFNQKGDIFIINYRNTNDMLGPATAAVTEMWFGEPFLRSRIIVHQPFYDRYVKGKLQ